MFVVATKSFNKDILRIKDKKILKKIDETIQKIEAAKSFTEIQNLKKMAGAQNAYRIRIGDYRLGFYFINGAVQLTVFASRKEIYKYFP
jgi:mRNA interferase RelE/StbE